MIAAALLTLLLAGPPDQAALEAQLKAGTGEVTLPGGTIEIEREIELPFGAHDLTIRGAKTGTTLHVSPRFQGRAVFSSRGAHHLRLEGFRIEGNRAAFPKPQALPPSDVPFSKWTRNNGILLDAAEDATVQDVRMTEIAGFAILVTASSGIHLEQIAVTDSGSLNAKGRNNGTGGILLEQGTSDFTVLHSELSNVNGNGIWTHALYKTPRNQRGRIAQNTIARTARDAIQIGHATAVTVEDNTASEIGFPVELVDQENGGIPVGIDTAGDTGKSTYRNNRLSEINGKCIDLDGFHDGEVSGNVCENHDAPEHYRFGGFAIVMNNSNPDMQSRNVTIAENVVDGSLFGGIFVIGTANRIVQNRLTNLNMARCPENAKQFGCYLSKDEPDLLRSGIYLGKGAERPDPARANRVEDNDISGYEMGRHCVHTAPGVFLDRNTVRNNRCSSDATVDAGNRMDEFPVGRLALLLEKQ